MGAGFWVGSGVGFGVGVGVACDICAGVAVAVGVFVAIARELFGVSVGTTWLLVLVEVVIARWSAVAG